MKRIALAAVAALALAAVAVPSQATLIPPPGNCAGATDIPVVKYWAFSEPPGSTVAHESINDGPNDLLRITPPYTGVDFNGTSVGFNDNGLLTTAGTNFQPGRAAFSVCIGYQIAAHEYNENLVQWGNSTGTTGGADPGFIKHTGVYVRVQGTRTSVKLNCVPSYYDDIGTGWHTSALVVEPVGHDAVVSCVHDGVVFSTVTVLRGLGSVNLAGVMSVGGKNPYADPTVLIDPHDLFRGRVAWIKVGKRSNQ